MSFAPTFKIGDIVDNKQLTDEFKVSNTGGIRKSNTHNCLVIVSDRTKGLSKIIICIRVLRNLLLSHIKQGKMTIKEIQDWSGFSQ